MALPDSREVGKFQQLIIKNPLAFVASAFFMMFGITYFINIRKNDSTEEYWKEMYEDEKTKNENLTNELLYNAGIIKRQNAVIIDADSTLREKTMPEAKEILKSRNNEK